jgi:hypothetical protein
VDEKTGEPKEGVFTGGIAYSFIDKGGEAYSEKSPVGEGTVQIYEMGTTLGAANYDITFGTGVLYVNAPAPSGGGGGTVTDPVADVIKLINALDSTASNYDAKAKEAVDAYNALTDAQKADERFKEQSVATKLADAQSDVAVLDVIDQLNALDPTASDYDAKAKEAVDAYNALTDAQKADERFKEQSVATKLADATAEVQADADKKAAQPVIDQINALDENSTKAEVKAARAAYDALTPSQQAACGSALFKLQGEEYRIYSTEAKAKKVKKFKVKNIKTKKVKATWKKTKGIDGYQMYYKAKGVKGKKVYVGASKSKKYFSKLEMSKKYTFKIRTYNIVYNPITDKNEKVFGKWSTKSVTIKK